jgi:hypothetical protein
MNWRWLLALPLAAFLCGKPVHAPRLRPRIPEQSECFTYAAARERYLLGYAYKKENPARSQALFLEAQGLLESCKADSAAEILRKRFL